MNDAPMLLVFLKEHLDYEFAIRSETLGYALFDIDFSSWKLRFSNQTPVIWIRASDLIKNTPRHIFESVKDIIRQQGLGMKTVILVLEGGKDDFKNFILSPLDNLVLIDEEDTDLIVRSNRPTAALQDLIYQQIPISLLAPYETTAPVTGSRFFGRDSEISRLISNPETNHLVLGIRRIGKTSLLRETERLLIQKKNGPQVVYLDCSDLVTTHDFVREVVRRLEPRELPRIALQKYVFYFPNFLERMKVKYHNKVVFILDEIDGLVAHQRGDWEVFRMLRIASNQGSCQSIVAGFRDAQEDAHELNSPLYNFAQPMYLNEFTHQQAKELIIRPMENLRVRINHPEEVVSRIYEETAGYPNLIQYYCMILVRKLDQLNEREIGPNNLFDIYNDEGFKNHLLASFNLNTRNKEKAIVYSVLANPEQHWNRGFTQSHIDGSLRRQNIIMPLLDIDLGCTTLKMAGFWKQKGREYFFTSPVFVKMLVDYYDPEFQLRKVKEDGL